MTRATEMLYTSKPKNILIHLVTDVEAEQTPECEVLFTEGMITRHPKGWLVHDDTSGNFKLFSNPCYFTVVPNGIDVFDQAELDEKYVLYEDACKCWKTLS